jgi:hypothetical protein
MLLKGLYLDWIIWSRLLRMRRRAGAPQSLEGSGIGSRLAVLSCPAEAVCIRAPNGTHGCASLYELVSDQRPNDRPAWRLQDGTRWLYQCKVGRWHVAGSDAMREGFNCWKGWISQSAIQRDTMPYDCVTPWQRWELKELIVDTTIRITAVAAVTNPQVTCQRAVRWLFKQISAD